MRSESIRFPSTIHNAQPLVAPLPIVTGSHNTLARDARIVRAGVVQRLPFCVLTMLMQKMSPVRT